MPPTPGNSGGRVGTLLSVYVDEEWRRQGMARALVETAVAFARDGDIGLVSLRPTDEGEQLYGQLGFWPTREMRLYLD